MLYVISVLGRHDLLMEVPGVSSHVQVAEVFSIWLEIFQGYKFSRLVLRKFCRVICVQIGLNLALKSS